MSNNNDTDANARPASDKSARATAKETAWNLRHDIRELAEELGNAKTMRSTDANWGDVGDLGRVKELLVQAAFALGQLTEEEAAAHGVTL